MHSDTHDVFVFQTAGSKRWEVHTPDGVEEVLLEPGPAMYLPTGTPHAARAQETVSLHVTLGINQLTWRGLVGAHRPAGRRRRARRPPPRRLPRSTRRAGRRARPPAGAARRRRTPGRRHRRGRRGGTPLPDQPQLPGPGGLRDVLAARELDDRPLLRQASRPPVRPAPPRRPARGAARRPRPRRTGVARAGPRGDPRPHRAASGRPADQLDPQSRLVLCRRLVREGLLEVVR